MGWKDPRLILIGVVVLLTAGAWVSARISLGNKKNGEPKGPGGKIAAVLIALIVVVLCCGSYWLLKRETGPLLP